MKADTSVKFFHSDMANAPLLQAEAGSLLAVLDACLINGFDSRSVDSIVVAGGVATLTISAGHAFEKHAVIEIVGADQAALNGQWKVASVTPSALTFACPDIADVTATGTITAKRAGLGWVKPFADAGTHRAVYRSADLESTRLFLYVDDANTRYTRVRGYEQVTGIDARVTPFPAFAQVADNALTWLKTGSTIVTPRFWTLVGDGRIFYLLIQSSQTAGVTSHGIVLFGDFTPLMSGDAYHCLMVGDENSTPSSAPVSFIQLNATSGTYIARGYAQTGGAIACTRAGATNAGSGTGLGLDGKCHLFGPVFVRDTGSSSGPLRGIVPGYLLADESGFFSKREFYDSPDGGFLLIESARNSTREVLGFDIVGPWR